MSKNLAEHYALPTPQQEVEDAIGLAPGAGEARGGKG
jgi:hypothetical protein